MQDLTGDPGRIRPDQPGTFMTGVTVFHRIRDHLTQKRANPSALKSADGRRRVSPVREVQGEEFARKAFAVGTGICMPGFPGGRFTSAGTADPVDTGVVHSEVAQTVLSAF